jgi:tRNA-dihydrouridine synthase 3
LLEVVPQRMHHRQPRLVGRSDLETLLASDCPSDWVKVRSHVFPDSLACDF